MKLTKIEAEQLDSVLKYMVENEDARIKPRQIMDLLSIEFGEAEHLYHKMLDFHKSTREIIAIMNALNLAARPELTNQFLYEGGFMRIFEEQEKQKVEKSEVERIKISVRFKSHMPGIALLVAVLSLIISILSLLIGLGFIKS